MWFHYFPSSLMRAVENTTSIPSRHVTDFERARHLPPKAVVAKCSGFHLYLFYNNILRKSYVLHALSYIVSGSLILNLGSCRKSELWPVRIRKINERLCAGFEFHLFGVRDRLESRSGYQGVHGDRVYLAMHDIIILHSLSSVNAKNGTCGCMFDPRSLPGFYCL